MDNSLWNENILNQGSQFATLQKEPVAKLPSWLTSNPDDLIQELHTMYGKVPSMMNTAGIEKGYNDAITSTRATGGQIATNAGREAVARAGITGGQINSEMAKAQAMLPVYDTTNKLTTDKEAAIAEQKKSTASLMAQIASGLGGLRTDYLSHLGQLQMSRQSQADAWTSGQQARFDARNPISLSNLAARTSSAVGAVGGVGGAVPNRFTPGYIPNAGPLTPATINGNPQSNTVFGSMPTNWLTGEEAGTYGPEAGWGRGGKPRANNY